MPNVVIAERVPLVDLLSGRVTSAWYRFFASLQPALVGNILATLNFGVTAAQTGSDLTITVPGAADGDAVTVCVPNACVLPNSCYTGWVSAPNVVTVRFNNYSAGAQNPPSGSFRPVVTRYT